MIKSGQIEVVEQNGETDMAETHARGLMRGEIPDC